MSQCDCDCCRLDELLDELGGLIVKHKCVALFKQGYTREQVNDILNEQLVPELNEWVAAQRESILRGLTNESSAGRTLN